ncbi:phosphatidylinositol-specific phospholipase C [Streptomyces sp. SID3212]|uniref:phosphatidylinositol-specific phospholipase C n=1 Tax=Streptomyces sp. SID3212 TaxID=2690259 RepID=UPI00136896F7|nr:phosphatidylinositol-specific phospholipase C [Streptomyces sp. SID3212]MYV52690.1 phosphatidylinositol-specific phospholipase C domain-containing protein [Streptomyces sp. SID3212]
MTSSLPTRRGFLAGALALSGTALVGTASAGAAVAAPAPAPALAPALAPQDWMGGFPDATRLPSLTIPGTHNSGARVGGLYVACQTTSVAEQLASGVRFLDIRCRAFEGAFTIHHAAYYQNLNFDDILAPCRDFLRAHPSETILMRVKQEYSEESNETFRRIFDTYLDGKGWRSLFRIGDGLPTLGEARGRVVLLADNGGLPGLRYGDGALFDIQDDYGAEPIAKYSRIEAHFRKAVAQPGKLFVNYVSTAALLPPRWNSDRLNPQVHTLLDSAGAAGWRGLGIVPLDFPATRPGLVESLLRHNG